MPGAIDEAEWFPPGMKSAALLVVLFACGGNDAGHEDPDAPGQPIDSPSAIDAAEIDAATSIDAPTAVDAALDAPQAKVIRTVFVIPMENKANSQIYGNTADAPFINSLLANRAAHATKFGDELPSQPSEPHYVWMEAGTNAFSDRTFTNDSDPSASNTTASTAHLVTQLTTAGVQWHSYQEGITSGTCPISSTGHYVAKHNPFVFFKDVVGATPSSTTAACATHHKAYTDFPTDLAAGLTGYVFITPDECHDMHGAFSCPSGIFDAANIKAGDTWLSTELPRIIAYTQTHDDAVIFITWDEGDSSNVVPFLAIGNFVKGGHTSTVTYSHSSLVKSVEQLLGVPVLPTVTSSNNFSDLFEAGVFN